MCRDHIYVVPIDQFRLLTHFENDQSKQVENWRSLLPTPTLEAFKNIQIGMVIERKGMDRLEVTVMVVCSSWMIALKVCVIGMSSLWSSWRWAASGNATTIIFSPSDVLRKPCVIHYQVVFLAVFFTACGTGDVTWRFVKPRAASRWSIDRSSMCSWCLCCCGFSRVGLSNSELWTTQPARGEWMTVECVFEQRIMFFTLAILAVDYLVDIEKLSKPCMM